MPPFEAFREAEAYYATLAHEIDPLDEGQKPSGSGFWPETLGRCRLRHWRNLSPSWARLLSAPILAISPEPREEHAAYIGNWLKVLKEDKRAIFSAAAHAQRAADYLSGFQAAEDEQEVAA